MAVSEVRDFSRGEVYGGITFRQMLAGQTAMPADIPAACITALTPLHWTYVNGRTVAL